MKIYFLVLALLLSLDVVLATDSNDCHEAGLRPYFNNPSFMPTGPFSEEKGYEVYLRLKKDKHLDDSGSLSSLLPTYPLAIRELQDELSGEVQKFTGITLQYKERVKYPVMVEEFYHDLFKIGGFFLHLAGETEESKVLDVRKTSEKWFYRAAINGHVYAWYGLGLLWLIDKAEEGSSSANYYLSILAISSFRFPETVIKNKDVYAQRAVEQRNPDALIEQSHVEEDKQDYQKTLDLLMEAHQSGVVRATYLLGSLYYYGLGAKALYIRLLEGELIPAMKVIALTKENDRIYSFNSKLNIKSDITEEYHAASGIAPNKELAYKFFKEAADKGYKPAILEIRNLFQKLEYTDPLSASEEVKPIIGFKGTFVDFLNVCIPNLGGNYRMIESLAGDFPYGSVYSQSTEHWIISSKRIEFYLDKERDTILKRNWHLQDREKRLFEENALPKISHISSRYSENLAL